MIMGPERSSSLGDSNKLRHCPICLADRIAVVAGAGEIQVPFRSGVNLRTSDPSYTGPGIRFIPLLPLADGGNTWQVVFKGEHRLQPDHRQACYAASRPYHRISSILCTAPSGRVSPAPIVTMRFKNAYASAEVSNLGAVRK